MSNIKVIFPSVLTNVTGGEKETSISASSLEEALNLLTTRYGEKFKDRVFESSGLIKRFINLYVNGKNILHSDGIKTQLKDGDEISILPAVAGG